MQIRAFGGLAVERDGAVVPIGGKRQRRLLSALLIDAGRPVAIDRLVEAVWPDGGSDASPRTVLSYVSRLRGVLGDSMVVRDDGAYILHLNGASFDIAEFEALADRARRSALHGRPALIDRALALWRGRPFGELADDPTIHPSVLALEERRLLLTELRFETALALGADDELVVELHRVVADHPLRERLRASLLLAMYRAGRQADALRAFEQYRLWLAEETGLSPSGPLAELSNLIACAAPELDPPRAVLRSYELIGNRTELVDGVVRSARDPASGELLTVFSFRASVADDERFIASFEALGTALRRLHHPNIQQLVDHWREPGQAHLVYQHVDGWPGVADASAPGPSDLAEQLAEAVAVLHRAGIVHGSLGPDTVALTTDGRAVLLRPGVGQLAAGGLDPEVDADALAELVRLLGSRPTVVQARTAPTAPSTPYVGLRPFGPADSAVFFGRETVSEQVVRRLDECGTVTLVGPSGAGKSSILHAGLLPLLRSRPVTLVTVCTPGSEPGRSLAQCLESISTSAHHERVRDVDHDTDSVLEMLAAIPGDSSNIVIAVDQLEELWTMTSDSAARDGFAEALAVLAERAGVRVVTTLRADFVHEAMSDRSLGGIVGAGLTAVGSMSAGEIERAITAPAAQAGVTFEPAVVAELVAGARANAAALPMLQYALTELYENRRNGVIDKAVAASVGDFHDVLAARAEETFTALDDVDRRAVRGLFARLVNTTGGADELRRRVSRRELVGIPSRLVELFGARRLLTFDRDPFTREATVEIAHEALLRQWTRAAAWVHADGPATADLRRLTTAAADWAETGRSEIDLARGGLLEAVRTASSHWAWMLTPEEVSFVAESDELARRERARAEAGTKHTRRLVLVAVCALVALAGTAVVAVVSSRRAARADARSERIRAATTVGDAALLQAGDLGAGWVRTSVDLPTQVSQRTLASLGSCPALQRSTEVQRAQAGPAMFVIGQASTAVLAEVHVFADERDASALVAQVGSAEYGACMSTIGTQLVGAALPALASGQIAMSGALPDRKLDVDEQRAVRLQFDVPSVVRVTLEHRVVRIGAVVEMITVPEILGEAEVRRVVDGVADRLRAAVAGQPYSPPPPITVPATTSTTIPDTAAGLTPAEVTDATRPPSTSAHTTPALTPDEAAQQMVVTLNDLGDGYRLPVDVRVEPDVIASLGVPTSLPECPAGFQEATDARVAAANTWQLYESTEKYPIWMTTRAYATVADADAFTALFNNAAYPACTSALHAHQANLGPLNVAEVGLLSVRATSVDRRPNVSTTRTGWALDFAQSGGSKLPPITFRYVTWAIQSGPYVATVMVDTRIGQDEVDRILRAMERRVTTTASAA